MLFCSGKSRFWSKPREGKGKFAATPNLAPVAHRVAACGPLCGLVERRRGTDTTQPIWARVGVVDTPAPVTSARSVGSCAVPPPAS